MLFSCLIAFLSSACALIIELIAGRILAPYVGVSLYTWTSIIGIVLAGMSAGNFLGGFIADRHASRRTLGLVFIAGSVASLGILVITQAIVGQRFGLSLLPRILVYTSAIFLLPSIILGMVSPIAVRLALTDLTRTGNAVGTIYACSTIGSIFGTFLTGFWLISFLGTRTIVWLVAGVLLATGLIIGDFQKSRKEGSAIVAGLAIALTVAWIGTGIRFQTLSSTVERLLLLSVLIVPPLMLIGGLWLRHAAVPMVMFAALCFASVRVAWAAGEFHAPCNVESNYYCIQVLETSNEGRPARILMLDRLVHSSVVLDDPKAITYGYERAYADLTSIQAARHPRLDTLFIGGGGYAFPRYVEAMYPESTIDVVEIDPAVIDVAKTHLGLSPTTRIRSFNQDARLFLTEWADSKRYDVVYGDAFNDLSTPYHLTTVEFDRIVAGRLKEDGIYLANVIDRLGGGEFLRAYAKTLREVFPYVYVFGRSDAFLPFDRNTYVLMASMTPLDSERFNAVTASQEPFARTVPLPETRLNTFLVNGRSITLTDSFAPVDQLLANLFLERGS